jgi:class 3 adenylate cyclase
MMMTEEHNDLQKGVDGILDYLRDIMSLIVGHQRETTARKRDGSVFPILLGLEAFEGSDGNKMLVAFARDLSEQKNAMHVLIEKNAAEVLLANVLPAEIALRLKHDPTHIADHHKMATVLFGDIVGFTAMSSEMSPGEVVRMLNKLFSLFDTLVDNYDLNKVKTIGDCYMVTSVPVVEHMEDDCSRICHFALDMHKAVEEYNVTSGKDDIAIRIGIHTGPVVAGVVGTKRFLYDLWGDAVNVASRMESTGVAGKTQVTSDIVDRVGDAFIFERRGLVDVKGKGEIETFFLTQRTGRRPSVLTNETRKLRGLELKSEKDDINMSLYTSLRILDCSNGDLNYQHTEDVQGTKDHLQPHQRGHAAFFEQERIYDDEDASEK